ncbi:Putative ribonuclease H protein [Dendrobium catenatum]|uniref:Ribonuclease H protein n=1 Tax=Dendrobium catenatum TaxID=906689 RepID=A0A2I0X4D1_9ASPA|nr:Putative ribonuclease H protein [Dendrobium catenatum]
MVLNWWNKNVFKNIFSNIKEVEEKINALEACCQNDPTDVNFAVLKEAKLVLTNLQCQEETYWKQKAAIKFLAEGDNNTSYFHALVSKKCAINGIHKIDRGNGTFTDNGDEIANLAVNFFQNHLNNNFCPTPIVDHSFIPCIVSQEENSSLCFAPPLEEVKNTLFDMNADSVAGPDVISKILVNRLSVLLPKLISPNQMGFVKSRAIMDNILIAQEFCQDLDIKTRGGNMILKLDIAKAYDNINWCFIFKMLKFFGFDDKFISLITLCIESPFFSIILNGKCHGFFKSSHGLRKGDPISPAIFILAVDYLSRGISDFFSKSPSMYFRTLGGINISHLCFADDFIIFMNASKNKVSKVLRFFEQFEAVSGLIFNKTKSGFVISKNVNHNRVMDIKNLSGFSQVVLPLKYLGIPLFKGRKKTFLFEELISKVHNRLSSWDSNFLSFGGRLVLIKSVLALIPVYSFQVLLPPKNVCLRIDRILNKFFWRGSSTNSKIHWS